MFPSHLPKLLSNRRLLIGCSLLCVAALFLPAVAPAQNGSKPDSQETRQQTKKERRAAARKAKAKKKREKNAEQTPKQRERVVIATALTVAARDVEVISPISGRIDAIIASEGDHIEANKVVVRLNDDAASLRHAAAKIEYHFAVERAKDRLEIEAARRNLEQLELQLKKGLDANKVYKGVVSESEIESMKGEIGVSALNIRRAERDHESAQSALRLRELEIAMAELERQKHEVTSPIQGIVVRVDVAPGQTVERGSPLCRVITVDPMRIEAMVPADKADALRPGSEVQFEWQTQQGSQSVSGKIGFVSPERSPVNGQVLVRADVENSEGRLRTGVVGTLKQ